MENFPTLLRLYRESSRGDVVKEAISAVFPGGNGPFDTDKCKADILHIAIRNQMGMYYVQQFRAMCVDKSYLTLYTRHRFSGIIELVYVVQETLWQLHCCSISLFSLGL